MRLELAVSSWAVTGDDRARSLEGQRLC